MPKKSKDQALLAADFSSLAIQEAQIENIQNLQLKIEELSTQLTEKTAEVIKLKQIINSGSESTLIVSDEEIIATMQLDRLRRISDERELTTDEVKRFDLLVKNKRLAQGTATTINADGLTKKLGTKELLDLAQSERFKGR